MRKRSAEGPITFVTLEEDKDGVFVAGSSDRKLSRLKDHFPSVEAAEEALAEMAEQRPGAAAVDFQFVRRPEV